MQELHDDGVDAAADVLWRGLHPPYPGAPASWRGMDSIGRSEFGGMVEAMISAYMETTAIRDGKAGELRYMQPRIIADITLYQTDDAEKRLAACISKFDPADVTGWDSFISFRDRKVAPGETARGNIDFAFPRLAAVFRLVPKIYFWRDGLIGEAVPVSGPYAILPKG